jgi:hypothetical protein
MGNGPNLIGEYRDGLYRRRVASSLSSGTTAHDLVPEESGTIFFINTATTMTISLPKISSNQLGIVYEFAIQEQASSDDIKIKCSKFDSSAIIQSAFSSAVDNHTTVIPASTFFTGGRFTAVSSIVWMLEQLTGRGSYAFSSGATDAVGAWSTG